jgi:hypothetical protein
VGRTPPDIKVSVNGTKTLAGYSPRKFRLASISTANTLITSAAIGSVPGLGQTGSSHHGPLAYPVLKGLNETTAKRQVIAQKPKHFTMEVFLSPLTKSPSVLEMS